MLEKLILANIVIVKATTIKVSHPIESVLN